MVRKAAGTALCRHVGVNLEAHALVLTNATITVQAAAMTRRDCLGHIAIASHSD